MIVLDTNVLSELMRPQPDQRVVRWVGSQAHQSLFCTSITEAEILYGIHTLPEGKRRSQLAAAAEAIFADDFSGRILPFNRRAALHYAELASKRQRAGQPIDDFDALIAATALAAGATVATRDTGGFSGLGLTLINPWLES